jgi:hypothetical protein
MRCPAELLDDVAAVIAEVRSWADVVERKPAVFYVGRQPFLHFHLVEGGRRRADIRGRAGWTQIALPRPLPASGRRRFLAALRAHYGERGGGGDLPAGEALDTRRRSVPRTWRAPGRAG